MMKRGAREYGASGLLIPMASWPGMVERSFIVILNGCITCGETIESTVTNALDAKKAWIEAAIEAWVEIYEPDSLEGYSGQFKLRIPRSLHRDPFV